MDVADTFERQSVSSCTLLQDVLTEVAALHLAPDMADLIDEGGDGRLARAVEGVRARVARDLGLLVPPVFARIDPGILAGEYAVVIDGTVVATASAPAGCALVMGDAGADLVGHPVSEPVFGLEALWVLREDLGPDVLSVDRVDAIAAHLAALFRTHAADLLTRDAVVDMITVLRERHPAACEEIELGVLPVSVLHGVLRELLSDGAGIRNLRRILDELARALATGATYAELVRAARRAG